MANSDWGQGANNNIIGWGQGASNNTVGWGSIHYTSWSGDTDIIGLGGVLNATLQARVSADGGVLESSACLLDTLITLSKI